MRTQINLFFRIALIVSCLAAGPLHVRAGRMIVPAGGSQIGTSVTALFCDNDGFVWVGTVSGLMRYDMYGYRYFDDCDSIPVSRTMIRCLAGDSDGNIWIGSETGAVVYDPATEQFRRIGGRIARSAVKTVTRSSAGTMLLTFGEGVAVVDPQTLEYNFISREDDHGNLNNILTTAVDSAGNIWGWSHGQLSCFDFTADAMNPRIRTRPFGYEVRALAFDDRGRLWFNDRRRLMMTSLPTEATTPARPVTPSLLARGIDVRSILIGGDSVMVTSSYDGIHRFRIAPDGAVTPSGNVWIDPASPSEVCNSVLCVMPDRRGNYWYGTVDGIYVESSKPREVFHNIAAGAAGQLIHNVVSDVCCGPDGAVWAATSGGLDCIRSLPSGGYGVQHFMPQLPAEGAAAGDRRLQTLAFDREGVLWVGTKRSLIFFDPVQRRFSARAEITGFLAEHGALFSKELCCDSRGNVWMGFIYGGLFMYDAEVKRCRTVHFADADLSDACVQTILEDGDGNVWLGTKTRGLLRFRPEEMILKGDTAVVAHYDDYFPEERPAAGLNSVNILFCTSGGDLYAGTSHGLFRYEAAQNRFSECPLNALGGEVWVLDMIGDRDDGLWVATTEGVYRYREDGQSPFYELADGAFARLDYNTGSCLDAAGRVFTGGINGITWFDPRQIGQPVNDSKVYVSRVSVLNRDIVPDGRHLEANINRSRHLTLDYDDYQLSLDFTTLAFAPEDHIRFYYTIDGLDTDWIGIGEDNRLSFSNLAPGEYVLRVKAADASGMLGEEATEIRITVLPPWWLTWWAYCIYGVLTLLAAAGVVWVILIRYRATQQVRMVQYKQQLFINLTHGLKTPLTMMQVPLQLMSDSGEQLSDEQRRGLVAMISTNVKKLASTVRQLMEFRKIDQDKVSMNLAEIDLVEYVRRICDYFGSLYEAKGVVLRCEMPADGIVMTLDPEKIELALYNLLQNAYTFTRRGGEVCVGVALRGECVEIAVRDTGIGIRSEYLEKIFRRFWQVHESDTMPPLGAGIGLAVAREFVEMHSGKIGVESRYGAGSTFTISLPLVPRFKGGEYYVHKPDPADDESILPVYTKQYADTELYVENLTPLDESADTVFVVAGGGDITGLLRVLLGGYNVLHYNNVGETLRAVRERRPQLILVDIVVYDREEGLALCRKIKESKQTNDIPVVLLTADNTPEDARLFCELGVDSWMEKPFDVELFRARVKQLVCRQADLQQKLKIGQILSKQEDVKVESADEKFMSRVMEVVSKNISNEEFSLAEFAAEMRVSRSVLNMRIQTIASRSPMELLRSARMQRAAQLLVSNAYDIAQVSYMVGFSDPRYFSTSFKKQFGESPRTYMQNNRKP